MLRRKRTFNGLGKLTNAVAVKQRQGGKPCLIAAEHFGDIIDLAVAVEIADKNAVIGADPTSSLGVPSPSMSNIGLMEDSPESSRPSPSRSSVSGSTPFQI